MTSRARELAYARLLSAYIAAGLFFLVLPGTLLGAWHLVQAEQGRVGPLPGAAWLQAHGHAQIFGWVGTFILGIGSHVIPVARGGLRPPLGWGWTCAGLWTCGVAMRWIGTATGWGWRWLLPVSAACELTAFLIVLIALTGRDRRRGTSLPIEPWHLIVMVGATGFAATVAMNVFATVTVAWQGATPEVPAYLNQPLLWLATWGFLAPVIWGFSTKWLPVLLGLAPVRLPVIAAGVALNMLAVLLAAAGWTAAAGALLLAAGTLVATGLRLFESPVRAPKTHGVHATFPAFVRIAYVWSIVAAMLSFGAGLLDAPGFANASRHAFTVGFVATMVFAIGSRMLPAFMCAGPLWSSQVMFTALLLLASGCVLRVAGEVGAGRAGDAWPWWAMASSAALELTAVTAFALNIAATGVTAPPALPSP